jgi:hypothetical protein
VHRGCREYTNVHKLLVWSMTALTLSVMMVVGLSSAQEPSGEQIVSVGRSYTYIGKNPHNDYPDPNGTLLTDGVLSEGIYNDKKWVGVWHASPVTIQLDLEAVMLVNGVRLHMLSGMYGIKWPKQVEIFTSVDGITWAGVAKIDGPPFISGTWEMQWLGADQLAVEARYVQVKLTPLAGGHFFFMDELQVY